MSKKSSTNKAAAAPATQKKEGTVATASSQEASCRGSSNPPLPPPLPATTPLPRQQRTIQVKIGSQAAQTLTPDQAAEYLKTFATAAQQPSAAAALKGLGSGTTASAREVKVTFNAASGIASVSSVSGSGRIASPAAKKAAPAPPKSTPSTGSSMNNSNNATSSNSSGRRPKGSGKDAAGSATSATPGVGGSGSSNGLPCSEKEMKALMSMFVEIMGLTLNTDKLNAAPRRGNATTAASTSGGGDKARKMHDSYQETDSLPDLEDASTATSRGSMTSNYSSSSLSWATTPPTATARVVVTGRSGLPIFEWDVLERLAIEDALEQEERSHKSRVRHLASSAGDTAGTAGGGGGADATGGGTGGRHHSLPPFFHPPGGGAAGSGGTPYSSVATPASTAAAALAAARKQHRKTVQAWKAQVVAAVQGSSANKLAALLRDSPVPLPPSTEAPNTTDNAATDGALPWEFSDDDREVLLQLLPYCVGTKNRKRKEHRDLLMGWVGRSWPALLVKHPARDGRTVLHTACWEGDAETAAAIVHHFLQRYAPLSQTDNEGQGNVDSDGRPRHHRTSPNLDATCLDSGWTALMYACASTSVECVEFLLEHAAVRAFTNPMLSWQRNPALSWQRGDEGVTARELLEAVVAEHSHAPSSRRPSSDGPSNTTNTVLLETHGMALEEVRRKLDTSPGYRAALERHVRRLREVEEHGYVPLTPEELRRDVEAIRAAGTRPRDTVGTIPRGDSADGKSGVPPRQDHDRTKAPDEGERTADGKHDNTNQADDEDDTSQILDDPHPKSESGQDPMIGALLGMGFAEDQIMNGIRACGGVHRATADDVVAWIFGSTERKDPRPSTKSQPTPASTVAAAAPPPGPAATSRTGKTPVANAKSKTKGRSNKPAASSAPAKRQEAAKHTEEERLAAEILAAKREEQRRRNREWNNRAQVRQQQEAQARISKVAAAGDPKTRDAAVPLPTPAASYFPPPTPGPGMTRLRSAPASSSRSTSPKPREVSNLINDTATIASSIDIDIGNDDATVSTLGSFQTRATPVPLGGAFAAQPPTLAQQIVPPGFQQPFQRQHQQHLHSSFVPDQLLSMASSDLLSSGRSAQQVFPPTSSVIPPPGIPETQPLVFEHSTRSVYPPANSYGAAPTHLPSTLTSGILPSAFSSSSSYGSGQLPYSEPQPSGIPPSAFAPSSPYGATPTMGAPSSPYRASSFGTSHPTHSVGLPQVALPGGLYGASQSAPVVSQDRFTGGSHGQVNAGLVGRPPNLQSSTFEVPCLFSQHKVHAAPPPLPLASSFGQRLQSAPASLSAATPNLNVASTPSILQSSSGDRGFGYVESLGLEAAHLPPSQLRQQLPQQQLDASFIDSFSTGSAAVPGASLWTGHQRSSKASGGSSLLLGNLIPTDSAVDSEGSPVPLRNVFPGQPSPPMSMSQVQPPNTAAPLSRPLDKPLGDASLWGSHREYRPNGSGSIW